MRRQRGVVLLMYVGAALVVIGMSGMALDLGQVYLYKTRLQNALDAAALDGAKSLANKLTVAEAAANANSTFNSNFSSTWRGSGRVAVEFSLTYTGAYSAAAPVGNFVKVTASDVPISTYLINVFRGGTSSMTIGGSAIAGPEAVQPCGAIPVAVCATTLGDSNCSDGSCFGLTTGVEMTIKSKATIGPGNFGLVDVCDAAGNCTTGKKSVEEGLAGGESTCAVPGDTIPTSPGAATGPTDKGINTRFGDYSAGLSSTDYPPDVVTSPKSIYTPYATYAARLAAQGSWDNPLGTGVVGRRIVTAPVIDCAGGVGPGKTDVPVKGSICLFLTQEASGGDIKAEMITSCSVPGGGGTPDPTGTSSAKIIVLYKSSSTS